MMPAYAASNTKNAKGMILMGSFLTRKYKNTFSSEGLAQYAFPMPTLTIGGEMDGLCRLTRIAESLHTQITLAEDPDKNTQNLPVTVIEGMSHMQFASGQAPSFVLKHDLRSEITNQDAWDQVAHDTASFMLAQLGHQDAMDRVKKRVSETKQFVSPIVTAFQMEANHQYKPPCYCESYDEYGGRIYGTCRSKPNCTGGTPWTSIAMQIMGQGDLGKNIKINGVDSTHIMTEERPTCHLPHIHGNPKAQANPGNGHSPPLCSSPDDDCTLNITTVTQQVYKNFGEFDFWRLEFNLSWADTGGVPLSAFELRTKMKSRQAVWQAANITQGQDFNRTDTPVNKGGQGDRCQEINQASIDFALKLLPEKTRQRYLKHGQGLIAGEDKGTCAAGPCWIWDALKYTTDEATGNVTINSVWFSSKNKNPYPCGDGDGLPCLAGFHYCKILSPARALEWMYVDGLRRNYGPQ
mmetsp:Transcript_33684/g.65059  ORF Transcript_33684/g.65059 Transcript_33684/m.65059 type:complete len:465 (-) Transcript_33684:359-1753(-)